MNLLNVRPTLGWCMGMAMVLFLCGCDGSINFTIDGAVKHASNGEIFRGVAFSRETIDEDPDQSNKRKDLYEFVATKAGVDVKANFIDVLRANPHYANVAVNGQSMAPGDETVDAVRVQFDVDKQVHVTLNFLQPEKRMWGPLRLNKLPILDAISLSMNGQAIDTREGNEILLTHIVNSNASSFSDHLGKVVGAMKAQALVEAQCKKEMPSTADFEVDPGLSPQEKERAYQDFDRQQNETIKACVQQRMHQGGY